MLRTFRVLLVAAFLLLPLVGCEDKITMDSYDQIKPGMQLYEVEKILGGKGEMVDRGGTNISAAGISTGSGQTTQQLYEWSKGTKKISVTVKDGKVLDKGKDGI